MLNYITTRDHRVMRRLNNWRAPRWVRVWAVVATRGGDGWLWYSMFLVVLFFGGEQKWVTIESCTAAAGLGVVLFMLLKRITGRKRPCEIEKHCWANLLPPDQFSFPSGHSITAFAIVIPLGLFYPSLMIGMLFCAVSIALSRVLLGLHFMSDVLVGSLIGGILGYLSWLIFS
jgi:undecaprenyl-diphosphatase